MRLALMAALLPMICPMVALAEGALPPRLLSVIKADKAAYLQEVAALIASSGQGDAITEEQLAVSVALQRTRARVAVLAPLMAADLDGDGAVSREEMLGAASALKAEARVRLDRAFRAADGNGDGLVSGEELAAKADAAALRAFRPAKLAEVKVLMGFDADADGRVTLDEVRAGVQALVS